MENVSEIIVPLGPLAIIFAGISALVLLKKNLKSRESDEAIKTRIADIRAQKIKPITEQRKRLEELLKK